MTDGPITAAEVVARSSGRPRKYDEATEEECLLQVALAGGSVRKAVDALSYQGIDVHESTLRSWLRGPLRNRYHEIRSQSSRILEEEIAQRAVDVALQIGSAEERALRQTLAGLDDANAVEASIVMRNLAQSKAVQVDKSGAIRGRPTATVEIRGLDEISAALARLGAAEIIEAEAFDEPDEADVVG